MTKATGIVRKIDHMGRFVLPMELRRLFDIEEKDSIEIFVSGSHIILRKYEPACVFCGGADLVRQFRGKNVCHVCAASLGTCAS